MALDVAGIRDGLKDRLATVSGVRCYDTLPEKPEAPAAVVSPKDPFIEYQSAFGKGCVELHFDVVLLTTRSQGGERAQDSLDAYLSAGTGQASSLIDALHGGRTLGGKCDDLVVRTAEGYGTTQIGGIEFVTARLTVDVIADRK